jgi:hypothetical protein
MTGFPNTYEDARRAAAYASLAYPGTYHLAFRRGHDTCVGPPALPLLIPGQARRHDEHQGYRQKGGNCQCRSKTPQIWRSKVPHS